MIILLLHLYFSYFECKPLKSEDATFNYHFIHIFIFGCNSLQSEKCRNQSSFSVVDHGVESGWQNIAISGLLLLYIMFVNWNMEPKPEVRRRRHFAGDDPSLCKLSLQVLIDPSFFFKIISILQVLPDSYQFWS